jgi:hypothetical protein
MTDALPGELTPGPAFRDVSPAVATEHWPRVAALRAAMEVLGEAQASSLMLGVDVSDWLRLAHWLDTGEDFWRDDARRTPGRTSPDAASWSPGDEVHA